jgi:hypothetical protein
MYLNVYVPRLQREQGVAAFFRFHRGRRSVSSRVSPNARRSRWFIFARANAKDDVAAEPRMKFTKDEGVVFIGKAQEKDACVPHRAAPQ